MPCVSLSARARYYLVFMYLVHPAGSLLCADAAIGLHRYICFIVYYGTNPDDDSVLGMLKCLVFRSVYSNCLYALKLSFCSIEFFVYLASTSRISVAWLFFVFPPRDIFFL